ncbi:MAG: ABC transporter permease [Acidobacteriota bacterium]
MADLPVAVRSLLKTPMVTAVAVLSLALGIGANAAIFSLFERVLVRPLPVPEPHQLVTLQSPGPKSGSMSTTLTGGDTEIFSYPMFLDLERADEAQISVAGHRPFGGHLSYGGETTEGAGYLVSGGYFDVLGLRPAVGRLIGPDDARTVGGHPVVVLSHAYWRNQFDQNPSVVGEVLKINGKPMTILGVAPEGFHGTTLGMEADVFVPATQRPELLANRDGMDDRRTYWFYLFGRLDPGVSLEQGLASLDVHYRRQIQDVEAPLQRGMSEQTLARFSDKSLEATPGQSGQSNLRDDLEMPMVMLFAVTALVLIIACANIANLLLVKANHRVGEVAVRLALGARRRQLAVQFLTESLLLSCTGAVLGFFFAHGTVKMLGAVLPAGATLGLDSAIGPKTLLFLAAMALITSLVGVFPALHSSRIGLVTALKNQAGKSSTSRLSARFQDAMATVQIALSMALLIAAGLFTQSLVNVSRVDLGLETETVATFSLAPERNGYAPEASRDLFRRVEEEVAALPGVADVAVSVVPLISGSNWGSSVSVQGFEAGPDTDTHSQYNEVGTGFFRTLGIPMLAGRGFVDADDLEAPKVAVVNEAFARKFGLGRDVVGKRMSTSSRSEELEIEIVGLAKDTKYSEVKQDMPPVFYLPYRQNGSLGAVNVYVRSEVDPSGILPSLRDTVRRLDPDLPTSNLATFEVQIRENVFLDRVLSTLSAAFAILASILAAVGLYGVVAFAVSQRTREIGLRMALGADAARVRGLVLRHVGALTVVGAVLGLAGAFGLGRVARSLLYGLEGNDPIVFAVASLLLLVIAFGAGLIPAYRASRLDPLRALRQE